ncbi:universal stress protein [Amycolatopsis benzoatilytica]|uniref:universal stress protein n=1 Tax=Amycolatopsis benzoatilytica TaxID=346045 RepID=UPI000373FD30|nr:universal stress protein [Amycolatopsis benzoatilytica]
MTGGSADIVVGVDGSAASLAARQWTLTEARQSGRTAKAVHARPAGIATSCWEPAALAAAAGAPFGTETVDGLPGPTLVEASAGAEMLVLGSHGQHGLLRQLVGSVSAYCLREAACPVVVIPARTVGTLAPPRC